MTAATQSVTQLGVVTPERIFDTLQAYRNSAALRTAIELDLFTQIAAGTSTAEKLAARLQASTRGVRILCDFLVTEGMLSKTEDRYCLSPDTALFLDRKSPAYMGGMVTFLCSEGLMCGFEHLTDCVRRGGAAENIGVTSDAHSVWVHFARGMSALQIMPAQNVAELLQLSQQRPIKILDIGAGHGRFGIALAQKYPLATLFAVDWPGVLEIAQQNADDAQLGTRFQKIAGNAFDVEMGKQYDAVLMVNFLHHFSPEKIASLLKRVKPAMNDNAQLVVAGFVPNDDGITPRQAARFNISVLASTPAGEAYPLNEIRTMLEEAGFSSFENRPISSGMQMLITVRNTKP